MAVSLPSGLLERVAGVSTVRWLMLLVVWGMAVFLWGTFGAWTAQRLHERELRLTAPYAAQLAMWLTAQTDVLSPLQRDMRLTEGISLPAGVESLPVQRVLYEFAYLNRMPDVYVLDLLRGTSGRTAGALPLPSQAAQRLQHISHSRDVMLLTLGERAGKLLLLRRIETPLPQRVYAAIPVALGTLASALPPPPATFGERRASLMLPHPDGWTRWNMRSPALEHVEDMDTALHAGEVVRLNRGADETLLLPLNGLPGAMLAIDGPRELVSTALLPRLMVLAWALGMSLLILWQEKVFQRVLAKATQPLAPLAGRLPPVAHKLKGLGVLLPLEHITRAWHDARSSTPLIEGPGDMDERVFRNIPRRAVTSHSRKKPLLAVTPASLAASTSRGPLPKVERRSRPRGSNLMTDTAQPPHAQAAKPAWSPQSARAATSSALSEASTEPLKMEDDDLLEVVKDCIRHKRILLMYQPIYRTSDNTPTMHEVFARLVRRDDTLLSPDQFLPVVSKNKLSLELDLTVLRRVVNEHFGQGRESPTPLALNISSNSLDGIAYLQEMASQGPRVLRCLGFEVSSQEMIRDPKALKLLKDLQKQGGSIAVDYFGGGEAMLDASKSLGFNYVKLDASRFMESDESKKTLIKLCQYAGSIDLPIILEKVGHGDMEAFGRRAGAQYLQGYALTPPQETLTQTRFAN